MTILAATEAAERGGWAGIWGILFGLLGIYLVWRIDLEVKRRREHSPTEPAAPAPRETRRSRASRLVSHDDETPRTERIGHAGMVSYEGVPRHEVIDLDLDGDDSFDNDVEAYAAASQESKEEYIARCIEAGVPRPDIVRALGEHYGVSRAQAYRLVPDKGKAA